MIRERHGYPLGHSFFSGGAEEEFLDQRAPGHGRGGGHGGREIRGGGGDGGQGFANNSGDLVRGGDRDVVLNEEMGGGVGGAKQELGDLEGGEGAFDGRWHAAVEGGEGEVGVLFLRGSRQVHDTCCALRDGVGGGGLTIMACMALLIKTNIQIGGLMNRMPAHMQIIAPAWW